MAARMTCRICSLTLGYGAALGAARCEGVAAAAFLASQASLMLFILFCMQLFEQLIFFFFEQTGFVFGIVRRRCCAGSQAGGRFRNFVPYVHHVDFGLL